MSSFDFEGLPQDWSGSKAMILTWPDRDTMLAPSRSELYRMYKNNFDPITLIIRNGVFRGCHLWVPQFLLRQAEACEHDETSWVWKIDAAIRQEWPEMKAFRFMQIEKFPNIEGSVYTDGVYS